MSDYLVAKKTRSVKVITKLASAFLEELKNGSCSSDMRIAIANNKYCPGDLLQDIYQKSYKDKSSAFNDAIAKNPSSPERILLTLLGRGDSTTKRIIATRSDLMSKPKLLAKLLSKKYLPTVRNILAKSSHVTAETLHKLISLNYTACRDLIRNSNTSIETLKELARHSNPSIVKLATDKLSSFGFIVSPVNEMCQFCLDQLNSI